MEIRYAPHDRTLAQLTGADARLTDVLRLFNLMPDFPWRVCWVRVVDGLALFHLRRPQEPAGEFHRVAVGLPTLRYLAANDVESLAKVILRRAADPRIVSVRLPEEAQAVKTPLGTATYEQVAA